MPSDHSPVTVRLLPLEVNLSTRSGTPLIDLLAPLGFEFPCGGHGICRGCRVRVIEGELPITEADRRRFSQEELAAGWRLACQAIVEQSIVLHAAQWQSPVLSDESPLPFQPQEGSAIAIDLGTTTIAAQLLDLTEGRVLASVSELNRQVSFGSDVMSRLHKALDPKHRRELTDLIRSQLRSMIERLVSHLPPEKRAGSGVSTW